MSGNAFNDITPVTMQEWTALQYTLPVDLSLNKWCPVGSTGLVPVMGDIDIAVEDPEGRSGVEKRLQNRFQTIKMGNDVLSIKYPLCDRWIQVDLMIGDLKFLKWSRAGSSDPRVKAASRAILLNAALREINLISHHYDRRVRFLLDFGRGLYQAKQVITKEHWRTTSKNFITNDPKQIVEFIFGTDDVDKTMTFEQCISLAKVCFEPNLLKNLKRELIDLNETRPKMLGDIDYIVSLLS
jgi:hypothetical protein